MTPRSVRSGMFIEAKAEPIDQRSFKSAMFGGLIWRS